jgi:uncharacterized protein YuzE
MKWTLDRINYDFRDEIPAVAIYLTDPEVPVPRPVRTIDLQGAHVHLDVDDDGNIVSIEIIGPAVYTDLTRLGEYLKEPPTVLGDE